MQKSSIKSNAVDNATDEPKCMINVISSTGRLFFGRVFRFDLCKNDWGSP